ncbi:carbohydrate kinase family protein [Microbacterium sp. SSW1-49]|uniref:Carbohydrate kinase family protein n=1 Tax=Microbacterium croceum TaxID=2851645 RepID=A0ABT0FA49_9MICO|nr:carbohydrate kinase family protein [Microbacterium croceum]MCK2034927.1 carbohydrate kinase family protein [Microbacterium croceum]
MMAPRRISVAGHVCVDLAPTLRRDPPREPGGLFDVGALSVTVGGCVGNTALALAGFDIDVEVQGVVGADALGMIVRDELAAAGIRSSRLSTAPGGTSYSIVIEPPAQDRTFWHHTGANDHFDGTDVNVNGIDLLHVGYPMLLPSLVADDGEPLQRLLQRAKDAGVTTSLDLAVLDPDGPTGRVDWGRVLARTAPLLDILTPSFDDLVSMTGSTESWSASREQAFAEELSAAGVGIVAISAGARGMSVRTAGAERLRQAGRALTDLSASWSDQDFRHDVTEVRVPVTTNGAGDASTAGFLAAVLHQRGPRDAAEWAGSASRAVLHGRRPHISDLTAGRV